MRALVGRAGNLEIVEVPLPEAGTGQVRIKVAAATVNPVDLATAAGALPQYGLTRELDVFPLGWDVAGTVDQVGAGVAGLRPGDAVIGLSDRLESASKAQAEFIVLDASAVAPAPAGVSPVEAATLPLNTLTAIQALDLAGLSAGQTLLVTGAAGAVGGFAVELAAGRGLRVVAVAGPKDEELVRGFSAEWFVPRGDDLSTAVRALVPGGVDGVVDAATVGLAALDAVRGGGSFVAVVPGGAPLPLRGIRVSTVLVRADAAQLTAVAKLTESGGLTLRVADTFPLEEAAQAHKRLAGGGLRGRLVLVP